MEQCVTGHYEASEARKVPLGENKEKNGTKEGERDEKIVWLKTKNSSYDSSQKAIKVRGTTNQIFLQNHPRRKKSERLE